MLHVETYWVRIYMSGPIDQAKHILRRLCLQGECVTIEPTTFIYTGGDEQGFVVGFVDYPRFPRESNVILERASAWAHILLDELHQHSFMLQTPTTTTWFSKR